MLEGLINMEAGRLARMPRDKALARGRRWGRFLYHTARFRRRRAETNYKACFPGASAEDMRKALLGMYENLCMNLVEMLRVLRLGIDDLAPHVTFDDSVTLDPEKVRTSPVLFLMGHIGNWEAMGAFTKKLESPITVVVKSLRLKGPQNLLEKSRAAMNLHLLPTRNAFRPCLKKLKEHIPVSIILDQNTRRRYGIFTEFFGRPACTTPGLAILSATAQSPVYFIYPVRQPDYSHKIFMQGPIAPPPDKQTETLKEATQSYNDRLEKVIRKHPDHWIWIHDRWRTQPKKVERLT